MRRSQPDSLCREAKEPKKNQQQSEKEKFQL
jgi:hypothetical protein